MKYVIPLELIRLEEESFHLALSSRFEEGGDGLWIIDTGASKTVFDISLTGRYDTAYPGTVPEIQSAGIGTGLFSTPLALLHPFSIGELRVEAMSVALIDLTQINHFYTKTADRKICGLLGSDFLLRFKAVIDYARQRMALQAPPKNGR